MSCPAVLLSFPALPDEKVLVTHINIEQSKKRECELNGQVEKGYTVKYSSL